MGQIYDPPGVKGTLKGPGKSDTAITHGHDYSGPLKRKGPGRDDLGIKRERKLKGLRDHPSQARAKKESLKGPKKGGDLGPKM